MTVYQYYRTESRQMNINFPLFNRHSSEKLCGTCSLVEPIAIIWLQLRGNRWSRGQLNEKLFLWHSASSRKRALRTISPLWMFLNAKDNWEKVYQYIWQWILHDRSMFGSSEISWLWLFPVSDYFLSVKCYSKCVQKIWKSWKILETQKQWQV